MAKISVTAGEGRRVPVPKSVATGPGGALLYLVHSDSELTVEGHCEVQRVDVDDAHHWVVRSLRNGDLVRERLPIATAAIATTSAVSSANTAVVAAKE